MTLIISFGAAGVRLPDGVSDLLRNLRCYTRDASLTYLSLLARIIDLRADIRSGSFNVDVVIAKARELQFLLADAQMKVPRSWRPRKETLKSPLVFGSHYDIYPSHYSTQVLNAFRIMRL
ncbi:hypothetical protein B0T11DRAFT_327874 [Plectosphaerella cucumerina]|uniref:Uncharacterized protein n=1 Tax=Plectosphaerella cucumerina TaxID=40658 RepID=A0A8K0TFV3_9PEZI|nr:hypothetical protein B0T11DRAFT_327874 [Plectosphaerella cucumerina]